MFDDEVGEPMPKQEKKMLKKLKKELAVALSIFSHFRRQNNILKRKRRVQLKSMIFGVIRSPVRQSLVIHM